MRLRCGARTDVGLAREHNEDNYGIGEGAQVERLGDLLVVCDGMGGHAAGEVASQIAVETILSSYYDQPGEDRALVLEQAFVTANGQIYARGRGSMGTTGVAALLLHHTLHVANVGDSRAYLIRNGTIRQISQDHSFVNDQIVAGLITPEEARSSPHRNVITRALGYQPDVMVDLFRYPLQVGDVVLLSSDGLHGLVSDDELAEIAASQPPEDAVTYLVDLANARGGNDNITVVLAQVEALDWDTQPITEEFETISEVEAATSITTPIHTATTREMRPVMSASPPPTDGAASATAAGEPAPTSHTSPIERRLSLLGALLATMLLAVLLLVILFFAQRPFENTIPIAPQPTSVPTPQVTVVPTASATTLPTASPEE